MHSSLTRCKLFTCNTKRMNMANSEESNIIVPLVEAAFSPVNPLESYKSLTTRGYGKEENGTPITENS